MKAASGSSWSEEGLVSHQGAGESSIRLQLVRRGKVVSREAGGSSRGRQLVRRWGKVISRGKVAAAGRLVYGGAVASQQFLNLPLIPYMKICRATHLNEGALGAVRDLTPPPHST